MSKMTCRACADFLVDYLDGQLDPDVRATFETHLDKCGNCRTYLEQMQQVLAAAGQLAEDSVAPEERAALLGAFRGWKEGSGDGDP